MNGSARCRLQPARHERVRELARNAPDVEHPVAALHPFQIDRGHVHAVAEQEVCRGRVAVQPDLLVLPHLRPVPPAVPQPGQLTDIIRPDPAGLPQPVRDRVEVPAVGTEIDVVPAGCPVVLRGEDQASAFSRRYRCASSW